MLDSGANVHIINNPSFLSRIKTCVDQWISTTGSRTKCTQRGDICDEMKPLPLPESGYLYHPNGIGNIISLSLLSDSHRITMDTDVENAFYVHNKHDGSYMKYTRCPRTNLYTYEVGEAGENNVLLHATVEDNEAGYSTIDKTRAKAVRELQEVLASPSDYDLANAIENNVVGATPFTRRDVRIASIIT